MNLYICFFSKDKIYLGNTCTYYITVITLQAAAHSLFIMATNC